MRRRGPPSASHYGLRVALKSIQGNQYKEKSRTRKEAPAATRPAGGAWLGRSFHHRQNFVCQRVGKYARGRDDRQQRQRERQSYSSDFPSSPFNVRVQHEQPQLLKKERSRVAQSKAPKNRNNQNKARSGNAVSVGSKQLVASSKGLILLVPARGA
jgi:hypothetical protein